jgi:hypothetical protein
LHAWNEQQIERLKRRYIGLEDDFVKVLEYVIATWNIEQLDAMEANDQLITWDSYFKREKLIPSRGPTSRPMKNPE